MLVVGKLPLLPPDHGWKLEDVAWRPIYLGERREELFDGVRLAQGRFAVFINAHDVTLCD